MKKTIKINISGIIFHLDEDAYDKLKSYLAKIHQYFESKKEGNEIIRDIELRIAELFQYKLSDNKQVINIDDVEEVIQKLGDPEEFDESGKEEKAKQVYSKRLYRDPDNAILGGVAAGIGSYFNIDPVWIRLILVLLMLGYGVIGIIYIILWLVIPKAETYEQKLEMRGENITISNIENKVKKEYEEVRENFNDFKKSERYKTFSKGLNEIFTVLGNFIIGFLKFILILAGVGLIIAGVVTAFYFTGLTFTEFSTEWFYQIDWDEFPALLYLNSVFDRTTVLIIAVSTILLALIPIFFIIYLIFRLAGSKGNDRGVIISGVILWILSLALLIGTGLWQVRNFSFNATQTVHQTLDHNPSKLFKIELANTPGPEFQINEFYFEEDETSVYNVDRDGNIYMKPKIDIKQNNSDSIGIEIKKIARGSSINNASHNAEKIEYNWEMNSVGIRLNPYYIIPDNEDFRMQRIRITFLIPKDGKIYIEEEVEEYLDYIDNDQGFWSDEMGEKTWLMKEDELILSKEKTNTSIQK